MSSDIITIRSRFQLLFIHHLTEGQHFFGELALYPTELHSLVTLTKHVWPAVLSTGVVESEREGGEGGHKCVCVCVQREAEILKALQQLTPSPSVFTCQCV